MQNNRFPDQFRRDPAETSFSDDGSMMCTSICRYCDAVMMTNIRSALTELEREHAVKCRGKRPKKT